MANMQSTDSPTWCARFEDRISQDQDLRELTTVRVGGRAAFLATPESDDEVGALLAAVRSEGLTHRVLGGGSNLLLPDGNIEGLVIQPGRMRGFSSDGQEVHADAGLSLSSLVLQTNDLGLAGAHVLSGIPGEVGGAVVMNAGGRHGQIGDLVARVHVRLADGTAAELAGDDMRYAYRSSALPEGAVVTSVRLRLESTGDARDLRRLSGRIIKEKNAVQPTTSRNFGCMFKNPPGGSAGKLIDEAGLRGIVQGEARISPLHGNFIENLGRARSVDVLFLLELAERMVDERFGVRLEREVRVWGIT
jgi:UDP-N-acetylmuramate dehydrogenase